MDLKGLIRRFGRKRPTVGDPVWWASKAVGAHVTEIYGDGSVVFQGGEIVKNSQGREVPRWTVATVPDEMVWNHTLDCWVVGSGPLPRSVRGVIIYPKPVLLSGKATGSFAAR